MLKKTVVQFGPDTPLGHYVDWWHSITAVWIGLHRIDTTYEWSNASASSYSTNRGLLILVFVLPSDAVGLHATASAVYAESMTMCTSVCQYGTSRSWYCVKTAKCVCAAFVRACVCACVRSLFLGHLLRDDLINPAKMSVRPSVRTYVRPYFRPYVRPYVRPQSNSTQPQTK